MERNPSQDLPNPLSKQDSSRSLENLIKKKVKAQKQGREGQMPKNVENKQMFNSVNAYKNNYDPLQTIEEGLSSISNTRYLNIANKQQDESNDLIQRFGGFPDLLEAIDHRSGSVEFQDHALDKSIPNANFQEGKRSTEEIVEIQRQLRTLGDPRIDFKLNKVNKNAKQETIRKIYENLSLQKQHSRQKSRRREVKHGVQMENVYKADESTERMTIGVLPNYTLNMPTRVNHSAFRMKAENKRIVTKSTQRSQRSQNLGGVFKHYSNLRQTASQTRGLSNHYTQRIYEEGKSEVLNQSGVDIQQPDNIKPKRQEKISLKNVYGEVKQTVQNPHGLEGKNISNKQSLNVIKRDMDLLKITLEDKGFQQTFGSNAQPQTFKNTFQSAFPSIQLESSTTGIREILYNDEFGGSAISVTNGLTSPNNRYDDSITEQNKVTKFDYKQNADYATLDQKPQLFQKLGNKQMIFRNAVSDQVSYENESNIGYNTFNLIAQNPHLQSPYSHQLIPPDERPESTIPNRQSQIVTFRNDALGHQSQLNQKTPDPRTKFHNDIKAMAIMAKNGFGQEKVSAQMISISKNESCFLKNKEGMTSETSLNPSSVNKRASNSVQKYNNSNANQRPVPQGNQTYGAAMRKQFCRKRTVDPYLKHLSRRQMGFDQQEVSKQSKQQSTNKLTICPSHTQILAESGAINKFSNHDQTYSLNRSLSKNPKKLVKDKSLELVMIESSENNQKFFSANPLNQIDQKNLAMIADSKKPPQPIQSMGRSKRALRFINEPQRDRVVVRKDNKFKAEDVHYKMTQSATLQVQEYNQPHFPHTAQSPINIKIGLIQSQQAQSINNESPTIDKINRQEKHDDMSLVILDNDDQDSKAFMQKKNSKNLREIPSNQNVNRALSVPPSMKKQMIDGSITGAMNKLQNRQIPSLKSQGRSASKRRGEMMQGMYGQVLLNHHYIKMKPIVESTKNTTNRLKMVQPQVAKRKHISFVGNSKGGEVQNELNSNQTIISNQYCFTSINQKPDSLKITQQGKSSKQIQIGSFVSLPRNTNDLKNQSNICNTLMLPEAYNLEPKVENQTDSDRTKTLNIDSQNILNLSKFKKDLNPRQYSNNSDQRDQISLDKSNMDESNLVQIHHNRCLGNHDEISDLHALLNELGIKSQLTSFSNINYQDRGEISDKQKIEKLSRMNKILLSHLLKSTKCQQCSTNFLIGKSNFSREQQIQPSPSKLNPINSAQLNMNGDINLIINDQMSCEFKSHMFQRKVVDSMNDQTLTSNEIYNPKENRQGCLKDLSKFPNIMQTGGNPLINSVDQSQNSFCNHNIHSIVCEAKQNVYQQSSDSETQHRLKAFVPFADEGEEGDKEDDLERGVKSAPDKTPVKNFGEPIMNLMSSNNSTAVGANKTKDNLNHSKASGSTVNTFNPLPQMRKSAFLFGSKQGTILPSNNLRYSQQNTLVSRGNNLVQRLQMKSMVLGQMNQKKALNTSNMESEQKQEINQDSFVIDSQSNIKSQYQSQQRAEKQIDQSLGLKAVSLRNQHYNMETDVIQEEQINTSRDKLSAASYDERNRVKVTDQITEKYGEEQDNTSRSQSKNEVSESKHSDLDHVVIKTSRNCSLHQNSSAEILKKVSKTTKTKPDQDISRESHLVIGRNKTNNKRYSQNRGQEVSPGSEVISEKSIDDIDLGKDLIDESDKNQNAFSKTEQIMQNDDFIVDSGNNVLLASTSQDQGSLNDLMVNDCFRASLIKSSIESSHLKTNSSHLQFPKSLKQQSNGTKSITQSKQMMDAKNDTGFPKQQQVYFAEFRTDCLRQSKKTTPEHSDDEITPRRGLEEMMSESKLQLLLQESD